MTTILAISFTSLARLANDEQKQVKLTAFDLQANPEHPTLQFHRVDKSKDPNFWLVQVSREHPHHRAQVRREPDAAYVDRHDDAYAWAERRRIETHPTTGAVQIFEVRELVCTGWRTSPRNLNSMKSSPPSGSFSIWRRRGRETGCLYRV
ncbi:hypothetical protein NKI12_28475 [Mesorhizobium australicum]|uniref:Uncharacterized protein n=1 Tax=Mesorhizobium australicum TaxID=536018 RepID=A0ACC6T7G9_9HYPH